MALVCSCWTLHLISTYILLSLCTASLPRVALCVFSSVHIQVEVLTALSTCIYVEESALKVTASKQAAGTHSFTSMYGLLHVFCYC